MTYTIQLTRQAEKAFDFLMQTNAKLGGRIAQAIDDIASDPSNGVPLRGKLRGFWKYRVGSYRIIYQVEKRKITVTIIDIGHRREIYR